MRVKVEYDVAGSVLTNNEEGEHVSTQMLGDGIARVVTTEPSVIRSILYGRAYRIDRIDTRQPQDERA